MNLSVVLPKEKRQNCFEHLNICTAVSAAVYRKPAGLHYVAQTKASITTDSLIPSTPYRPVKHLLLEL